MDKISLSGAAIDTLHKLFLHGPQDDGDLPSKSWMAELISIGLATKDYERDKANRITSEGELVYGKALFYQAKAAQ